jgi:hypothetical protein
MIMNLIEGILEEIDRNQELLEVYKKIPTGGFGAAMIRGKIEAAKKAMATGDTIGMIQCYADLRDSE